MHGPGFSLIPVAVAAAYVSLGSLLLASRTLRTGPALGTLWLAAVLPLAAAAFPSSGPGIALVVGGLLGSLVFAAWSLTGLLLLHAFTGGSHGGPPPHDGR